MSAFWTSMSSCLGSKPVIQAISVKDVVAGGNFDLVILLEAV
jgi:hypothetical protein